jgi:dipeptidyl aminopeptidase/acylaminoacyl peptidase
MRDGRAFGIQDVHALPGGAGLLYARFTTDTTTETIVLHRPGAGADVDLVEGGTPRYLDSGHLLFARGSALFAAPLDVDAGRLTADPVLVVEGIARLNPVTQYAVSNTGTLLYIPGEVASESVSLLYRVSRDGAAAEAPAAPREYSDLRISPDGRRLAVHLSDQDNDVWVTELARGAMTRMSFAPLEDETAAWSPDGHWLAYSGWCGSGADARCVYKRRADGSGESNVLARLSTHVHVTDWSPDGSTLVLESIDPERRGDILLLDAGGGAPRPFLATPFAEQAGRVSPDGKWLAYQSSESGQLEVYLQSFRTSGGKIRVSTDGGVQPVWSRDGRELYFRSPTHVMAARVISSDDVNVDRPIELFRDSYLRPQGDNHTSYDVLPDGSFLFIDLPRREAGDAAPPSFIGVFNWHEELAVALRR